MRILERCGSLVFTHFVTDAQRLPEHRTKEIEDAFVARLRARGIVVGIRFAHDRGDPRIRVVLERRPRREDLEALERALAAIVEPIPTRPPVTPPCTSKVRLETPEIAENERNSRQSRPSTGVRSRIHPPPPSKAPKRALTAPRLEVVSPPSRGKERSCSRPPVLLASISTAARPFRRLLRTSIPSRCARTRSASSRC